MQLTGYIVLNQTQKETLIRDALRASYEAVTLEDLGTEVLPLLERAFETSTSVIYRCNEKGSALPMYGGFRELSAIYFERYASQDPLHAAVRRLQPLMVRASQLPEWRRYLKHPAYTKLCRPNDLDYYVHLRLSEDFHLAPGMVGLLLSRSIRQPDFNDRDGLILAKILPALEALIRRSIRLQGLLEVNPFLGTVLELDPRPKLALDRHGALLWASERAEILLNLRGGTGRKKLPDVLVKAARGLGSLLSKNFSMDPPTSIAVPRDKVTFLTADLRLARSRIGDTFVLIELEDPEVPPLLQEIGTRHQLTAAETQVLRLLSLGLSDREIGRRLFVSKATVHSHMTRILSKLGVRSRVQAALIAHGHKIEGEPDEE